MEIGKSWSSPDSEGWKKPTIYSWLIMVYDNYQANSIHSIIPSSFTHLQSTHSFQARCWRSLDEQVTVIALNVLPHQNHCLQEHWNFFIYSFSIQIFLSIAFIIRMGACSLVQVKQVEKQRDICPGKSFHKLERLPRTNQEQICWARLLLNQTSCS